MIRGLGWRQAALLVLAACIVVATILLVSAALPAFALGTVVHGGDVTLFSIGGLFLIVFVAVGAGFLVRALVMAATGH